MTEIKELSPRQELLLQLIVKEHVANAGTVASRALVDTYNLEFSPATVRNEMSRLEELGFLLQPHTSAGRVPTEAGYRYFVQRLMREGELPRPEKRMIAHQFHQARKHFEEWLPLASNVLAKTANVAGVITAPRTNHAAFKHLELISTRGRAVLLILVMEGGSVEQQMLVLAEQMSQQSLREAADRLNHVCAGLSAAEIAQRKLEFPPLEVSIADLVISTMEHVEDEPTGEMFYYGLSDLLREPEFAIGDNASNNVVRVLEEQSLLNAVLSETLTPSVGIGSVKVLIGGEGRWDELSMCSMVVARYGVPSYATGALGVVGPIRMPYGRAISAVRFVANVLGELVYDMYQPGINSDISIGD